MLYESLDIDKAIEASRDLQSYVERHHLSQSIDEGAARTAQMLSAAGRHREANALLETIAKQDTACNDLFGAQIRAQVLVETGFGGDCDSAIDTARTLAAASGIGLIEREVELDVARRLAQIGEHTSAIELLRNASEDIDDTLVWAMNMLWRSRIASEIGDLGSIAEGAKIVSETVFAGSPLSRLALDEVTAIHAAACGESSRLSDIVRRWERHGFARESVRARLALASIFRICANTERELDELRIANACLVEHGAIADLALVTARLSDLIGDEIETQHHVSESRLFDRLTDKERDLVCQSGAVSKYAAGKVFFEPGVDNGSVWLLRSGRVRLYSEDESGKRFTVEILDPGSVFGENAVLGRAVNGLWAAADEDVSAQVISAPAMRELIGRVPRIGFNLLDMLGERLDRTRQLAEQVALWPVDKRPAWTLLDLADRYGHPTLDGGIVVNRRFTIIQLAELVNARRETVGATMKQLRDDGLIAQRERRIVIPNADALRTLVNVP
jgi:CRP/FNR family transcriptional regulator